MSHSEDVLRLRKRVLDAVSAGVVKSELKDFYEATLLQILNEAERQRQVCTAQAESFRKQAAVADGQASGYAAMGNIVYSVLNSYINQAERAKREEERLALERAEKEALLKKMQEEAKAAELKAAELKAAELKAAEVKEDEVEEDIVEERKRSKKRRIE